jgi:hypothetical protein
MKTIITGTGPDGRSRVERQVDMGAQGSYDLWNSLDGPPDLSLPADGFGYLDPDDELVDSLNIGVAAGAYFDIGVAPGGLRWVVSNWGPNQAAPVHWTRTVDFDTVLAGSIDLILEDGTVTLMPGDCVLVTGVRHGWRAGPEGCVYTAAVVGVAG